MNLFLRKIFLTYFRPYWKWCLLLLLCLILAIAFETIFPLGIEFLIDHSIEHEDGQTLVVLIVAMASLYVISTLGNIAENYLTAMISARATNDLRLKMFTQLQDLPAGFYARLQSGEVMNSFNNDLITIQNALIFSVVPGVQLFFQLMVSTVVLFMLNVPLALVTLLLLPLVAILPKRIADRATVLSSHHKAEEAHLSTLVQEQLQAHAVNRIYGLRERAVKSFSRHLSRFETSTIQSTFYEELVPRTTNLGQYLVQLLVIAVGVVLVFRESLSIGSLVGFIALLESLGKVITSVASVYSGLIPASASLQRVEALLNEKTQVVDQPNMPLAPISKEIRFNQVTFGYPGTRGKPNLNQVSFAIPAGRSVAIIGRSGSGKSTLLNLLMRFYDPYQGQIFFDDQDAQQVSLTSLRSQMGIVFQDTFLYNTTLRENIRMGKLAASDAEVEEAAKAAGIHEFIISMPDGYETPVVENGKCYSAGQSQRIALARALVRRPAVLLLDEVTAALDPETECQIYETLMGLRSTCTILMVTHRLAPVAGMDQILVMDGCQVTETGTHIELMQQGGLYHQLYTQQSGFKVSSDGKYAEVIPARLRAIPLFEKLDDASLEQLANQFITERFGVGETVIREGDLGDKFYIVVRGKVSVTATGPDQKPVQIAVRQDGEYFGEIALLESSRRTATLQALQPSLLLSLERKHFQNMIAMHPSIREAVEEAARSRKLTLNFTEAG